MPDILFSQSFQSSALPPANYSDAAEPIAPDEIEDPEARRQRLDRVTTVAGVMLMAAGAGLVCSFTLFNHTEKNPRFSSWPRDRFQNRPAVEQHLTPGEALQKIAPEEMQSRSGLPVAFEPTRRNSSRKQAANSRHRARNAVAANGARPSRTAQAARPSSPNAPVIPSAPTIPGIAPQTPNVPGTSPLRPVVSAGQTTVTVLRRRLDSLIPDRVTYVVDATATKTRQAVRDTRSGVSRGVAATQNQAGAAVVETSRTVSDTLGSTGAAIGAEVPGLGGGGGASNVGGTISGLQGTVQGIGSAAGLGGVGPGG